ncbi:HAD-IIA family hydrolase [Ferrimonas lipolytica]|uniref:Ribonucleotide monophosphatase NagD n=1 Tax=Ferrimonas lipolytica TaxID=2724191 RepID=A0A6H1UDM0_9GAMM|nr:HAD-IIA family hydrolase [Ferrimonas lipolytica]QIZ76938.1 HAD-IIA family hydrolase [Ferrimonas lipolytica]
MKSVICDIDGVLLHNNELIPGADRFIARLRGQGNKLVCLTNYPVQTAKDLANRLQSAGIDLDESHFYTSAMATADFLTHQEGRRAYVVGEGALTHELYKNGFTITDINPEFVIVGETRSYNWDMIHRAASFIANGARFIATNPDTCGPNFSPACGALCAPIERITGKKPFYVGKPSSYIIRAALNHIDSHSTDTIIVGDNMSTDILAGFQAGLETVLVLSGVSKQDSIEQYPFRPNHIFANAGEIDIV